MHTTFTYAAGQFFDFTGDDVVWVFIDKGLVIDLGGVHGAASAGVDLDTLGLTVGTTYDLDFFLAERHTVASNLTIETSIPLVSAVPIPAAVWQGGALLSLMGAAAIRRRMRRN